MRVNFLVVDFHFERISKQRLFATYHIDVGVWIRPLECSRKLSVRLCATAHLQKVAVQAMEGPGRVK